MSDAPIPAPAGWYPDGSGDMQRYWDGREWTSHFAPLSGAAAGGPVATKGDWIAGAIVSAFVPLLGLIAGLTYVAKGGQRARCGWMCVGISVVSFPIMYFVLGLY